MGQLFNSIRDAKGFAARGWKEDGDGWMWLMFDIFPYLWMN